MRYLKYEVKRLKERTVVENISEFFKRKFLNWL